VKRGSEALRLEYVHPSGLRLVKEFRFYAENYYVEVTLHFENLGSRPLDADCYLVWGYNLVQRDDKGGRNYNHVGPSYYLGGELEHVKPKDIEGELELAGSFSWAALQNTYFAAIFVPKTVESRLRIRKTGEEKKPLIALGLEGEPLSLEPGGKQELSFGVYIGPQAAENLRMVGASLVEIIDYGWFGFLARPLMEVLRLFYRYTGNYGVAIIVLTVVIKLLFWPLTTASFKSMKNMQKIQPKVNELRKKYKDDPQKLNREMMELYRKYKVNPLGGCMPMLLQIPVFFALYKALLVSIELRHAPFIFWIKDLSAKDPYYITPILMGISMLVQQKMTPSSDPKQAKLMLLMPVIFTVMFLNFPTGLVIYWLMNNILTIGQQYLINKKL